ncbi:MAG: hypothetical protein GXY85_01765 [Candidatus Brocadiaceae bacterium]|nr:hypothetical protein [Candidatus Brocadiaceae bacterium]
MALNVGFGTYGITPPLGVRMAGYFQRVGVAEDVHDELTARSIAFESGRAPAILCVADVCMMPQSCVDGVCGHLGERIGVPPDRIVVASTHTHSGPALHGPGSAYGELLPKLVAGAGELAWKRRAPARLSYGTTKAEGLCINRRSLRGPVDEEVIFLTVEDEGGRIAGVLFAFSLHGVIMGHVNLSISADYIGVARRVVEAALPGAAVVFGTAPSGDANPLTPSVRKLLDEHGEAWYTDDPLTGIYDRSSGTFEEVELLGTKLGQAVVDALGSREPVENAAVRTRRWTVDVGAEGGMEVPLTAFELGDVTIVSFPGEQFVETGATVKQMLRKAGRRPMVLSHAGPLVYVPPKSEWAKGGYEIVLARRRKLAPDAQERLVDSIRRELSLP